VLLCVHGAYGHAGSRLRWIVRLHKILHTLFSGGLVVRPACTDYSHQKFIGKNGIFLTRLLNLTATEEKCAI